MRNMCVLTGGVLLVLGVTGYSQDSNKSKSRLTADEIELLKLASRQDPPEVLGMTPDGRWVTKPKPQTSQLSSEEKMKLLTREFRSGGRGSQLALRLLAFDILVQSRRQEAINYQSEFAGYPNEMRKLAFTSVGLALRGENVPPPFSDEFKNLTASSTAWVDRLRKSKALQSEIHLELERVYFQTTLAVEKDLIPAMSKESIPAEVLKVLQGTRGETLLIKNAGTQPLTNVVLLSLVWQSNKSQAKDRIPLEAIDAFNRAFGTDEQANDAQRYLKAEEAYAKMPKYASKYIAKLEPGQEIKFTVGNMERGEPKIVNINTLGLYCDQGRITSRRTSEFPQLKPSASPPTAERKLWRPVREVQLRGQQTSVAFSPNGKTVAAGTDGTLGGAPKTVLTLLDASTGKEVVAFNANLGNVPSVAFSPDGKTLASGGYTVKLWDVNTGKEKASNQENMGFITSVAFSPDSKTLACAGVNGIRLWNLAEPKKPSKFKVQQPGVRSVAFSQDGTTLASGGDKGVALWDLSTGVAKKTFDVRLGARSVAFSPDGLTLAAGCNEWTIKLWDVSSGNEKAVLKGHNGEVNSVSFSPDGKMLASGSVDRNSAGRMFELWDLSTGNALPDRVSCNFTVRSVAFSPDGKTVVTASSNKISFWEFSTYE